MGSGPDVGFSIFSRGARARQTQPVPRQEDHEYSVEHYGNTFYIRTKKGAKNFRVVTAPVGAPQEKNWQTFIAHNPNVKIDGVNFFADYCVVSEKEGGLDQLRIINMKTFY